MYAEKAELFQALETMLPHGSTSAVINDMWQTMAQIDVESELHKRGISLPVSDNGNLLKLAEICFYFDIARLTRQIETTTGDIKEEQVGSYKKSYNNSMPMFFFAQGAADPFYQLLPNEGFRQRGYKYINMYAVWLFKQIHGHPSPRIHIGHDNTSRGNGWETQPVDTTNWRG